MWKLTRWNQANHIFFATSKGNYNKKVCNNIMNSIKLWNRTDTKFMISGSIKTSEPRRLLLNLSDKISLKRSGKYVALGNLSIFYTWKNIKISY